MAWPASFVKQQVYEWRHITDEDARQLYFALPKNLGEYGRRNLLRNLADRTIELCGKVDVSKAMKLAAEYTEAYGKSFPRPIGFRSVEDMRIGALLFCPWATSPDFDPATLPMEEYVTIRYCNGDESERERVSYFYKKLVEYRSESRVSRWEMHPDYEWAGGQSGILANGIYLIRLFEWEHRDAVALRCRLAQPTQ